jgi:DNA-binding transcriptional ArsR family regulator
MWSSSHDQAESGEPMSPTPVTDATNPVASGQSQRDDDPGPGEHHPGGAVDAGQHTPRAPGAGLAAFEAAGELLRALAAPVRIAIVVELGAGPQCVHDLVQATGAPQPLVSQHLRVLRGAGVVRGVRRGREIAYSLTDEHIGHIVADAISHAREPR